MSKLVSIIEVVDLQKSCSSKNDELDGTLQSYKRRHSYNDSATSPNLMGLVSVRVDYTDGPGLRVTVPKDVNIIIDYV